jgi:hypothetical protein
MQNEHKGVMITVTLHGQVVMHLDSYMLFHILKYADKPRESFTGQEFYVTFEPYITIVDDLSEY